MMFQVTVDTAAGTKAMRERRMPAVMESMMEKVSPQAAYFGPDGGHRTTFIIFRWMTRPSCSPSASREFRQARPPAG